MARRLSLGLALGLLAIAVGVALWARIRHDDGTGPASSVFAYGEDRSDLNSRSSPAGGRAADAQTQAGLRNALTAAKTVYTDASAYTMDVQVLHNVEPSVTFLAGVAETGVPPGTVFVLVSGDGQAICLSSASAAGHVFAIKDVARGDRPGISYTQDSGVPDHCDDRPLVGGWN